MIKLYIAVTICLPLFLLSHYIVPIVELVGIQAWLYMMLTFSVVAWRVGYLIDEWEEEK